MVARGELIYSSIICLHQLCVFLHTHDKELLPILHILSLDEMVYHLRVQHELDCLSVHLVVLITIPEHVLNAMEGLCCLL